MDRNCLRMINYPAHVPCTFPPPEHVAFLGRGERFAWPTEEYLQRGGRTFAGENNSLA